MIYNSIYNLEGYWSPVTSSIDWCEENFIVSKYIAEFWNTISNGIYVVFALVGMWSVIKYRYDRCYFWANFGLLTIGIGSWLFHMTLKYQMELADELPMIYTCCIAVFCIFEIFNNKTYRPNITIILWLVAILFTITYTNVISWPWFQHGLTALLIFVVVFRSLYIVHYISKFHKEEKEIVTYGLLDDKPKDTNNCLLVQKHLKLLKGLLIICCVTYALAFFLWNIDNIYCGQLMEIRNKLKSWGFLFQFHAWWHFFTGIGTYAYFVFNLYLRSLLSGYKTTHIKFLLVVPYVAHNNE